MTTVAAAPAWDNLSPDPEKPKRAKRAAPPPDVADGAPHRRDGDLRHLPLAEVHESPWNPRRTFDEAKLEELAASLRANGQWTPAVVRPRKAGGYEIGAGHRRRRAAERAGLPTLLCLVQELDDAAFCELLVIENNQREDVHALEEAEGFRRLMEVAGLDVRRISERVGRSIEYVYARLKLLQLTKEAKRLFLGGAFEAGHAILLARLSPADQARAIASERSGNGRIGGLFVPEHTDSLFDADALPEKPVSVREFAKWIDDEVRFPRAAVDPVLFPATFQVVEAATARRETIVPITYCYHVPDAAKVEGERTYGPQSWKRADGADWYDPLAEKTGPSKVCAHAVTGVIVVGYGRGEAFKVCVAKKKCAVHWPARKAPRGVGRDVSDYAETLRKEQEENARRDREREAKAARWKKAVPTIAAAVAARVAKLPATAKGPLADYILATWPRHLRRSGKPAIGRGTSAEDLVRHIAVLMLEHALHSWSAMDHFPKVAGRLGINVKKILEEAAGPAAPPGTKVVAEFRGARKRPRAKARSKAKKK